MLKNAIAITATAATLALGATGMARATALDLPEYAPVPMSRAEALMEARAAEIRHFPVIRIGATPQAIPAERQNVRMVGARFLPPVGSGLALKVPGEQPGSLVASIETASAWVLKTASAGLFGEAVAAQNVASIEGD